MVVFGVIECLLVEGHIELLVSYVVLADKTTINHPFKEAYSSIGHSVLDIFIQSMRFKSQWSSCNRYISSALKGNP
jgi:hypothetical protein